MTGGAGFIGSNFCNINKGKFEVIALDNLFLGDEKNLDEDIQFIKGDAGNVEELEKVGKVDYVVHLAGTSSAPMFMDDGFVDGYVNSIKSFATVLDWARKNGVKKVLYASTSSLYGNNPLSSAYITKRRRYRKIRLCSWQSRKSLAASRPFGS